MIVPAIYRPGKKDAFFHASMACRCGKVGITDSYRVNRVEHAINVGKRPCRECWTQNGYDALNDIRAAYPERNLPLQTTWSD